MATRTVEETRAWLQTQGALNDAAFLAQALADRFRDGAAYLLQPAVDGKPLTVTAFRVEYAKRVCSTLRALVREASTPVLRMPLEH